MYVWIVFLHVAVIFVFLIQHAAEIIVSFRLRMQTDPDGIADVYAFLPGNNTRNLRITFTLIILSGAVAGFMSPWWRQAWMWTALGLMVVIWAVMKLTGSNYLNAVDAITEAAREDHEDESALEKFRSQLKARREPEIMTATSVIGGLAILWLMMFKPF